MDNQHIDRYSVEITKNNISELFLKLGYPGGGALDHQVGISKGAALWRLYERRVLVDSESSDREPRDYEFISSIHVASFPFNGWRLPGGLHAVPSWEESVFYREVARASLIPIEIAVVLGPVCVQALREMYTQGPVNALEQTLIASCKIIHLPLGDPNERSGGDGVSMGLLIDNRYILYFGRVHETHGFEDNMPIISDDHIRAPTTGIGTPTVEQLPLYAEFIHSMIDDVLRSGLDGRTNDIHFARSGGQMGKMRTNDLYMSIFELYFSGYSQSDVEKLWKLVKDLVSYVEEKAAPVWLNLHARVHEVAGMQSLNALNALLRQHHCGITVDCGPLGITYQITDGEVEYTLR